MQKKTTQPVTNEVLKFLEKIELNYYQAKTNGRSRMSIEWGKWSREMNLELRVKMKKGYETNVLMKYLFMYWINRSELLELYYKNPLFGKSKRKQLMRQGKKIKDIILSGNAVDVNIDPNDVRSIMSLLGVKK